MQPKEKLIAGQNQTQITEPEKKVTAAAAYKNKAASAGYTIKPDEQKDKGVPLRLYC